MKVDLAECGDGWQARAGGSLLSMASRLGELWHRFPTASKGLLSLGDQAIVSATSFATAIIINRTTTLENVGLYYLTLSIVSIAVGIQEHVVAAPYMIYSCRRQGAKLAEYTGSTWLHHLVLTALSVLALLVAIGAASLAGSVDILPGLWVLLGAGPLILLREWIRRFAFVNLEMGTAIAIDSTVAVAQVIGLALLAYFGQLSIYTIYTVMGGACALACLGWYLLNPPTVRFDRRQFLPDWIQNWAFANWAVRSYLIGSTTPYIMPWILNLAIGIPTAGVFGACWTLIGITNVFLGGVGRVLNVRGAQAYAAGGREELRGVLLWGAAVLTGVLGTFSFVLALTGSRLAVLVYGDQFRDSGPMLVTLALSALMTGLGSVVGNGLWSIEKPRSNIVADVCSLVVTLGAAALLVVPFGPLAGALAMLIGSATAMVVRTWTLLRALDACSIGLPTAPPLCCLEDTN